MHRFLSSLFFLLVVVAASVSALPGRQHGAAMAQAMVVPDGIPPEIARNMRRAGGDHIAFCVHAMSMLADFERDLAQELGDALLVSVEIVDVRAMMPTPPYDFRLPLIESEIFYYMAQYCDAFMGFTPLSDYPEWLMISPTYLTTHTVLAVRSGEHGSLADIPPSAAIGTRLLSLADSQLAGYIQTLPAAQQWGRTAYPNHEVLIERLMDGSAEAILIWEPALLRYLADHPEAEDVRIIRDLPFTIASNAFALALRSQEDFLNTLLADAIAGLEAAGTIDRLAAEHGLVAPSE